ncbi:MAG TPA: hypothetical protein VG184_12395 [Acidimicrobiales bacterium]|jgi:hypothetical protein|nr:hypothetical protein [Acidimicrobiales bacterium]
MAEVPNGLSVRSLAHKAGTDANSSAQLYSAVFDAGFLKQLGRMCVADLLIGNNDRMVARAMNLGNLMVSSQDGTHKLWAIDSNAVLGQLEPDKILSSGSASSSLQGGFTSTAGTFEDSPTDTLDGFFRFIGNVMKEAAQGGLQPGPAEIFAEAYQVRREASLANFEAGWNSGLQTVRDLVATKTGRKKMKGLTEEVGGEEGASNVSYSALKVNAMYLGAKAKGASHQEASRNPAGYAALRVLAEFDPTSVRVPDDGYSWNVARVPSSEVLTASLDRINALPAPRELTRIKGENKFTLNPQRFAAVIQAAEDARSEVAQLGKKSRGLLSKSELPRNRVIAGKFVADTYTLGAGAVRTAASAGQLSNLVGSLRLAVDGQPTPSQAQRALPAAEFLQSYRPNLQRDLNEFGDGLRAASGGVNKIRKYKLHPDLAKVLADLATYVDDGAKKITTGPALNPSLYTNLLKSASK